MEYAWGAIWARPGLDYKTRSMITIATLVGMGKLDELKLHFRATRKHRRHPRRGQGNADAFGDLLRRSGGLRRLPGRGADFRRDGQGSGRESLMRMAGSRNPVSSFPAKAGHPGPPVAAVESHHGAVTRRRP